MNLLIIGRGQLGSYLQNNATIGTSELSFRQYEKTQYKGEMDDLSPGLLRKLNPDAIINTAGKTSLEWCEENPLEAHRCNVIAPLRLWRRIKEAFGDRVPLIHMSSGCIWDGPFNEKMNPFDSDDRPNPASYYAWTKALCESMLLQEASEGKLAILRPRQVYSDMDSPRNTLDKLRRYDQLIDTPNSMTSVSTIRDIISEVLAMLVRKPGDKKIVLNVYDKGLTSPYEVGVMMAKVGLRKEPTRISKKDLDQILKPRRVDVVMKDPFFESLVYDTKRDHVTKILEDTIASYAENRKKQEKQR